MSTTVNLSAVTEAVTLTVEQNVVGADGVVVSVNGETGTVVIDADDIDDAATTNKFTTAADISKLAGIETGATADQTGAEIKAAYEAEADTNAFTDAEKSKLAGIESGAEVNIYQESILLVLEPLDTDASAGTKKAVIPYFPYNLDSITLNLAVDTAPTGSAFIVDLNVDDSSILSTKISIDDGETASSTAATAYVLTTTSIAEGAKVTVDIDQVGATTPGQNPVLTIEGVRS